MSQASPQRSQSSQRPGFPPPPRRQKGETQTPGGQQPTSQPGQNHPGQNQPGQNQPGQNQPGSVQLGNTAVGGQFVPPPGRAQTPAGFPQQGQGAGQFSGALGPGSAAEFWHLAVQSQLMNPQQAQLLQQRYQQATGGAGANAAAVAQWLISQQNISRFQADVLLARQPGPFIFGQYKIFERIEQGRLSGLFRAVHVPTGHPICLQFLAGPLAQDPRRIAEVAHHASIYNSLQHNNLLRVYHFSDLQAYRMLVVENLYGQSLQELLAKEGRLPATEACRVAWQAALGLMRLEESSLTHGELQPSNIWLNHLGTVKLLTFPLHRNPVAAEESLDLSQAANPQGRVARLADYLAPELSRNGGQLDHRAEVYSLGCILYQMLTGQVPLPEQDTFRKILRHASEPVVPPAQVNPQVPPAVSQLVMYMLAKEPASRYQRAAHVAEALTPYIQPQRLTVYADPPTQQTQAYDAWVRQHHPATQADPDTGEFDFSKIQPDRFEHVRTAQQQPVPAFPGAQQPGMPNTGLPMSGMQQTFGGSAGGAPAGQGSQSQAFPPINTSGQQPTGAQLGSTPTTNAPQINLSGGSLHGGSSHGASSPGAALAAATGSPTATVPLSNRDKFEQEKRAEEAFNKKLMQWVVGGTGVVVALVVLLIIWNNSSSEPEGGDGQQVADQAETGNATTQVASVSPVPSSPSVSSSGTARRGIVSPFAEIYAQGDPLWDSPLEGAAQPLNLKHLPLGVQVIVVMRPAELLASDEGRRVWQCLGSWAKLTQAVIESRTGTGLQNLEEVILGFLSTDRDPVAIAVVARPNSAVPQGQLLAAWGQPQPESVEARTMYVGGPVAYYTTEVGGRQLIISGPAEFKSDLLGQNPPVLRKEMEILLKTADRRRHLNVLLAPSFLFSGAKKLFDGSSRRLKDPVDQVLRVDDINLAPAALLSAHLGEYFLTELKIHGGSFAAPITVAERTQDLLLAAPGRLLRYYQPESEGQVGFVPTLPNRKLLARLPRMLSAWAAYARSDTEDREIAVVSSVLPRTAAHNLAFGIQVAVNDPGVSLSDLSATGPQPKTLEDKLRMVKIPLVITRDSLDRVLDLISEENGVAIRIEGGDLQLDGITKNQSFGVSIKEPQPIGQVIQEILLQANPIKTVKKLDEPNQKLVYVISPDKETLIVTTRAKAWTRGTPDPVFGVAKP